MAADSLVGRTIGHYLVLEPLGAKAEEVFLKAMKKHPRAFWRWVGAGGSYLGVRPQQRREQD